MSKLIDTCRVRGLLPEFRNLEEIEGLTQHDVDLMIAIETLLQQGELLATARKRWSKRHRRFETVLIARDRIK